MGTRPNPSSPNEGLTWGTRHMNSQSLTLPPCLSLSEPNRASISSPIQSRIREEGGRPNALSSKVLNDLSKYLATRCKFQTSLGGKRAVRRARVVAANVIPRAMGTLAERRINVVVKI